MFVSIVNLVWQENYLTLQIGYSYNNNLFLKRRISGIYFLYYNNATKFVSAINVAVFGQLYTKNNTKSSICEFQIKKFILITMDKAFK